jgi:hypothetical protein
MEPNKKPKSQESFFNIPPKLSENELKKQIENYDTLGILSSARKLAAISMIFISFVTLIMIITKIIPAGAWFDVLFCLILSFFVYNGQKWAMLVNMIYWVAARLFSIVNILMHENNPGSVIPVIIFGWLFFVIFYQAYQVEKEREKLLKTANIKSVNKIIKKGGYDSKEVG